MRAWFLKRENGEKSDVLRFIKGRKWGETLE